ncbi:metallophosphoesterase family protein [Williamsia herbipolensis]|uniref:metallophosphoesterase family protein n=1 Tax=Williamsia herbipolensis TaxID=1603258 RepID=UPI0005F81A48|nr:metallophosphoesterase [Williamsia herbipolensis]MCX6468549.1 metallophosphoesterase [Mycobacteriales bacterium]
MVRVLAVADEVVDGLTHGLVEQLAPDLILGAGDLPFDYLETLSTRSGAPCVFVPGNHDRDLAGFHRGRSGWTRAGLPANDPGPAGAVNADGRVVTVAGLRIAGLGGSIRYNDGPNQYREGAQRRRADLLRWRHRIAVRTRRIGARPHCDPQVDILLTHSPARGYGDGDDGPHIGFRCLVDLVQSLRPQALIHGHIHPYGQTPRDRRIPLVRDADPSRRPTNDKDATPATSTLSLNTVGYTVFDIEAGGTGITVRRRRHGS